MDADLRSDTRSESGVRSPEKAQRSSNRVWEAAKASIARGEQQHTASKLSDNHKCIGFIFPGPAPNGEERVKRTLSASQKGHVTSVKRLNSASATAVVFEFDDVRVASRTARGYGQQIQMGSEKVKVTWPAAAAAAAGGDNVRPSAAPRVDSQEPQAPLLSQDSSKTSLPRTPASLPPLRKKEKEPASTKKGLPPPPPSSSSTSTTTTRKEPPPPKREPPSTSRKETSSSSSREPRPSSLSKDPPSLFLGGMAASCTEDDLRNALKSFADVVVGVCVRTSPVRYKGKSAQVTTFAYVKFSSEEAGHRALAFCLQKKPVTFSECRLYNVSVAAAPPTCTTAATASIITESSAAGGKKSQTKERPVATTQGPSKAKTPVPSKGQQGPVAAGAKRPERPGIQTATATRSNHTQDSAGSSSAKSAVQKRNVAPSRSDMKAAIADGKAVGNVTQRIPPATLRNEDSGSTAASRAMSVITVSASNISYDYVVAHFVSELQEAVRNHGLKTSWQAGRISIVSARRDVCENVEMNMFRQIAEKYVQLSPAEYTHLANTPPDLLKVIGNAAVWGRLLEKSAGVHHLLLVGPLLAVDTAWKLVTDFLRQSICLSLLQVEFLQRYTNAETTLLTDFGVSLENFNSGSKRLNLTVKRLPKGVSASGALKKAKGYVASLLKDWSLEKVEVEQILLRTASRLVNRRKLSVVLAMLGDGPKSRAYVLGGAPSGHVVKARSLLASGPVSTPVQLPVPPFTATYVGRLLRRDPGIELPADLSCECLGDVHVINTTAHAAAGDNDANARAACGSVTKLEIRSYVEEDVLAAVQFFRRLAADVAEQEVEMEASSAAPLLSLYYLAYILVYDEAARNVMSDIEREHKVAVRASTTSLPCVVLSGSAAARRAAHDAIFNHTKLLCGVAAMYVSLPTLPMAMVPLLRKRFLAVVEQRVSVVCLTFQATQEIVSLLKIPVPSQSDSVVVAIFGHVAEDVDQAQRWISSLGPANLTLSLSTDVVTVLQKRQTEVEERYVVSLVIKPDKSGVVIAGLTSKDVDFAKQVIVDMENDCPSTEEMNITAEQQVLLKRKLQSSLDDLNCKVDVKDGEDGATAIFHGTKRAITAGKAQLLEHMKGTLAVHITVSFPSQLADCLTDTWKAILKESTDRDGVMCQQQDEAFAHAPSTTATTLDCRAVLQLPDSFPDLQIDGHTCFLVLGSKRKEFTDTLQSIHNAGSSVVKQAVVLSPRQQEVVQKHFDEHKAYTGDGAFMHTTQKGIHVCAPSHEKLNDAKRTIAKWLERDVTIALPVAVRKLLQDKIRSLLTQLASKHLLRAQWTAGHLVLTTSIDDAETVFRDSLAQWEKDVCTRSLSIGHWLVPQLCDPSAIRLLDELEESGGVVCSPCRDVVADYQKAVVDEMKAKVEGNEIKLLPVPDTEDKFFVTPPSALVWHLNGMDEEQIVLAGRRLGELLSVPLQEVEMCVPGEASVDLCKRVAEVAAEHLVQVAISVKEAGYGSGELFAFSPQSSCVLTVRGIAPRPGKALQTLQGSISP